MNRYKRGFSLVEVLLAISIFVLMASGVIGAILYGEQSSVLSGVRARAVFLSGEGMEAVRGIRDRDFSNLSVGTHGISQSSGQWEFSGNQDAEGIYTRRIQVSSVDGDTFQVQTTVSWPEYLGRSGEVSLVSYLTNWRALREGQWANPALAYSLDLTGNNSGEKVQIQNNYAYVILSSGTPNFLVIDITDPLNLVLMGSATLSGPLRNLVVSGNYAYIASGANNNELQIVNIATSSSPTLQGSFNAPGNQDAHGVAISGSTAYIVRSGGTEMYAINVSNPSSPSSSGSLNLSGSLSDIVVSGSRAYVASSSNSEEVQVVNISNPASMSVVSSFDLAGNGDALSLAVLDNTLFAGKQGGEIFAIDISNPASLTVRSSANGQNAINNLAIGGDVNQYLFAASDENSAEFQVINIQDHDNITIFGITDVSGNSNLKGVASYPDADSVVGVSDDNSREVMIFQPN